MVGVGKQAVGRNEAIVAKQESTANVDLSTVANERSFADSD
jgi:hypothetical protein